MDRLIFNTSDNVNFHLTKVDFGRFNVAQGQFNMVDACWGLIRNNKIVSIISLVLFIICLLGSFVLLVGFSQYVWGISIGLALLAISLISLARALQYFGSSPSHAQIPNDFYQSLVSEYGIAFGHFVSAHHLSIQDIRMLIDAFRYEGRLSIKLKYLLHSMPSENRERLKKVLQEPSYLDLNDVLVKHCPRYWCQEFYLTSDFSQPICRTEVNAFVYNSVYNRRPMFRKDIIDFLKSIDTHRFGAVSGLVDKARSWVSSIGPMTENNLDDFIKNDPNIKDVRNAFEKLVNDSSEDSIIINDALFKDLLVLIMYYSYNQIVMLRNLQEKQRQWLSTLTDDRNMLALAQYLAIIDCSEDNNDLYDPFVALKGWDYTDRIDGQHIIKLDLLLDKITNDKLNEELRRLEAEGLFISSTFDESDSEQNIKDNNKDETDTSSNKNKLEIIDQKVEEDNVDNGWWNWGYNGIKGAAQNVIYAGKYYGGFIDPVSDLDVAKNNTENIDANKGKEKMGDVKKKITLESRSLRKIRSTQLHTIQPQFEYTSSAYVWASLFKSMSKPVKILKRLKILTKKNRYMWFDKLVLQLLFVHDFDLEDTHGNDLKHIINN